MPEILLSGDHARIEAWRRRKSLEATLRKRPDLLAHAPLAVEDVEVLRRLSGELDLKLPPGLQGRG